jgi:membrane associated rhomboid family serine protease
MNIFLLGIIGANVLISYKGFNDFNFFRKYEFHVGSIRAGEQIRMLSSGFLHGDFMHLFFNMFTLYMFAPVVIYSFGSITFLMIYFISLVAGSLLTLSFHKNDFGYRAVGASGAVTGIVYASILLNPDMSLYMFFIPIPIPAYIFGIGYLLYSIYGMKAKNDNIGHVAHFGGAIGGFATTLLKEPSMLTDRTFIVVLLVIPIVLLYFLDKGGKL